MFKKWWFWLILAILLIAISYFVFFLLNRKKDTEQPSINQNENTEQSDSSTYRIVDMTMFQYEKEGQLVINTGEEWESFTKNGKINSFTVSDTDEMVPISLPAPDFNKETIIVVAMGTRPNGGYSLELDKITENAGITVYIKKISPGQNCITTQAFVYPLLVVAIPKTNLNIDYNFVEATSC